MSDEQTISHAELEAFKARFTAWTAALGESDRAILSEMLESAGAKAGDVAGFGFGQSIPLPGSGPLLALELRTALGGPDTSQQIVSPRDPASGLPTGKR